MNPLSKRLLEVAKLVPQGSITGDIGSDHGYLTYYLFEHNIISKGYASDNKAGPYSNLCSTFKDSNYDITLKMISGLEGLPDYVNTLLITGMGGELITSILFDDNKNLSNIKRLILSPQGNEAMLRRALVSHNFKIVDEKVVFDQKYYLLLVVVPGQQELSPLEEEFGPVNLIKHDITFVKQLNDLYTYEENLLTKFSLSSSREEEIKSHLSRIKEALNYGK